MNSPKTNVILFFIFIFTLFISITQSSHAAWQIPPTIYGVGGSWGSAALTNDNNVNTGNEYLHETPSADVTYDLGETKDITQVRIYLEPIGVMNGYYSGYVPGEVTNITVYVSEDPDNFLLPPVIEDWAPMPRGQWQNSPMFSAVGRYVKFVFNDGGYQNNNYNYHNNYSTHYYTCSGGTPECTTTTTTIVTVTTTTTTQKVDPQINEVEINVDDIVVPTPQCGIAAKNYTENETSFDGTFCAVGAEDVVPVFPDYGQSVSWNCINGMQVQNCEATRNAASTNEEIIKSISDCECYQIGSEESLYSGTISFVYSDNDKTSWDYVPMPDSDGKDCDVTHIKMINDGVVMMGADFTYETITNPICNLVMPEDAIKECKTINIKNITKNSVDLRVEVDRNYSDKQKFKVEVENIDIGEKEIIKLKKTPSNNGMVTLFIDRLNENTNYRFKVKHQGDGKGIYEYCPHSKNAKTDETIIGPTQIELPVCGTSKKAYDSHETKFTGDFCAHGSVLNKPDFPQEGKTATWLCTDGNEEVECTAIREDMQKERVIPLAQGGTVQLPSPPTKEPQEEIALMSATIGLIAVAIASIPLFPMTLQVSFFTLFAIPFIKRKPEKYWGVVFDNYTKQPQKNAIVSLIDTKTGERLDSMVTDDTGRYGFLISKEAHYEIDIKKGHYVISTQKESDSIYGKIYIQPQNFQPETPIELNIALKQDRVNWENYANNISRKIIIKKILNFFMYVLFIVGTIYSVYVTINYPHWMNYVVITIYAFVIIYLVTTITKKHYGTVTNKENKNPIPFTLVELHQNNQRKYFTVTDIQGRYYLLAKDGGYTMKIKGQPAGGHIFEKQGEIIVNKGIVREDIEI